MGGRRGGGSSKLLRSCLLVRPSASVYPSKCLTKSKTNARCVSVRRRHKFIIPVWYKMRAYMSKQRHILYLAEWRWSCSAGFYRSLALFPATRGPQPSLIANFTLCLQWVKRTVETWGGRFFDYLDALAHCVLFPSFFLSFAPLRVRGRSLRRRLPAAVPVRERRPVRQADGAVQLQRRLDGRALPER